MKKINVYVVTHKKLKDNLLKDYTPIAVGHNLIEDKSCVYQKDNIGENISLKNASYCELTAQYWIWKNDSAEIKGLCHYRRFFSTAFLSIKKNFFLKKDYINKIMNKYDIILPKKKYVMKNNLAVYCDCGYVKDMEVVRMVLQEKYPDYIKDFDAMISSNGMYWGNMFITHRNIFDEYCEWLFDILFEVEKRVDISNYTPQEARIFGYISERLLDVWVRKHNYNIKEMRVVNTEDKHDIVYYIKEVSKECKMNYFIKAICYQLIKRKNDK